ncbi:MAG: phosphate acetyltransferase [SAR116 cluster bacterium MED-G04]|jgi:phosphate acetyltransferase|nr:MAG: phosphate acetyltransferase [SAR116 cluster bacterium MED-G04]HCD49025.1 phosphate acetyltransferase [Alphaproteobacteria bacterium]HCV63151.1 phosphate acetyltransferase [Alphaproteobacteria bacterium]|tara:strand:+ start:3334 stop:4275 length:942 start_codon:yes stop_codon:yes gene_type:complete
MTGFISTNPPQCPQGLIDRARLARTRPMRLAIARASAPLPMQTAHQAWKDGIANPVLIGEEEGIRREAEQIGWDLDGITIHNTSGEEAAIEATVALARSGAVDALMKGHLHSDVFMGGIVKRDAGIRGDKRMVHVFAMYPRGGGSPLLISDAAVNVAPDRKTREQALITLADTAIALGIERPRIAILSATETPIASIPSSMEARELSAWAQDNVHNAVVTGPLSFDLAVAPEAVTVKELKGNPVAGQADALLVPEITAGNILFKSLVWFNGACAAGVVIGGNVPIILTSRADHHEARMASIAMAALLSGKGAS